MAKILKKRLLLNNELSEIQKVNEILAQFGAENELSDETLADARLALDEIITNIIMYGYEDKGRHQIEVCFDINNDDLVLEVKDDARSFNPLKAPKPDIDIPFEERPVGGLGIFLVRKLMDELAYQSEEGRNILIMKKRFSHLKDKN